MIEPVRKILVMIDKRQSLKTKEKKLILYKKRIVRKCFSF